MPNFRIALVIVHDLLAVAAAWLFAFALRFNLELPEPYYGQALESVLWVVPLYGVLFLGSGLYRGIWRFASLPDLQRIIASVALGALAVPALLFMLQFAVPRSVLVMSPVLLVMIMGGSRLAYRGWKERSLGAMIPAGREPVVLSARLRHKKVIRRNGSRDEFPGSERGGPGHYFFSSILTTPLSASTSTRSPSFKSRVAFFVPIIHGLPNSLLTIAA